MRPPMVSEPAIPRSDSTTGTSARTPGRNAQPRGSSPLIERFVTRVSLHSEYAARCPRCGSRYLHQSGRKWWQRFLAPVTARRPHYCEACLWRGWRRPDFRSAAQDGA